MDIQLWDSYYKKHFLFDPAWTEYVGKWGRTTDLPFASWVFVARELISAGF